jgi:hypothetical protein
MDGVASRHPEVAASLSTLRSTVESVAASALSSSASSSPHRGAVLVALESSLPTTTVVTGWSAAAVAQGLSRGLDGTPETVVTPAEALLSARGFTAAVVAAMDVEVAPLRIASRMLMGYIVVDAARSLPPHHVVVVDGYVDGTHRSSLWLTLFSLPCPLHSCMCAWLGASLRAACGHLSRREQLPTPCGTTSTCCPLLATRCTSGHPTSPIPISPCVCECCWPCRCCPCR